MLAQQRFSKLEKRVKEVEQYYLRKGSLQPTTSKEKDGDKHFNTIKKQQQDASCRDAATAKRMRDLLNDSDIFAPTFSLAFTRLPRRGLDVALFHCSRKRESNLERVHE